MHACTLHTGPLQQAAALPKERKGHMQGRQKPMQQRLPAAHPAVDACGDEALAPGQRARRAAVVRQLDAARGTAAVLWGAAEHA